MTLVDLADPWPTPAQLVIDSSLLLALRKGDDNPRAAAAHRFIGSLGQQVLARQAVAWLLPSVLQECYHVILSRAIRRAWEVLPSATRPANWLAAYKHQPELLATGFADLTDFDAILAAIPITPAQPRDLDTVHVSQTLTERMRYFITTYNLLPQDALILAEAERLGVSAIATLDSDWRRVAEFDIYTTPVSPLASDL
jgi:predicted nucleic acid-binding protein